MVQPFSPKLEPKKATTVFARKSIPSNRKCLAGILFALTLGVFLLVAHLFFSGYGNSITQGQFYGIIILDALLLSVGIFSWIQNKLRALIVTLGVLTAAVVIFIGFFDFLAFSYRDLFPGSANIQRLKALEADWVLKCPVANSSFSRAGHDSLTEYAGHTDAFDTGTTPTQVFRDLNLNGANPKTTLAAFSTCAYANGWHMSRPDSDAITGDPEQEGTKTFPGGWSATLHIHTTIHPTDYRGKPNGPPTIELTLNTDYVP